VKLKVKVEDSKLVAQLRKLPAKTVLPVKEAVRMGAEAVRNTMLEGMQRGPHSGRFYRVPGYSKMYQASAPGEYPAVATGNLIANINVEMDKDGLSADIGVLDTARVDYAAYLEYGTRNMEARPFIAPSFEANEKEIKRNIQNAVKKVLSRG